MCTKKYSETPCELSKERNRIKCGVRSLIGATVEGQGVVSYYDRAQHENIPQNRTKSTQPFTI